MKTPTAIAVSAVTLGMFGIIGWLEVSHVDVSNFIVMVPLLLPGIAALFGVTSLKTQTQTIQTNTNGTLSALREESATATSQLMRALAHLDPTAAEAILSGVPAPLNIVPAAPVAPPAAPVSPVDVPVPSAPLQAPSGAHAAPVLPDSAPAEQLPPIVA